MMMMMIPLVGTTSGAFECDPTTQADLVLLVDGSWSIGRTNFRRVRDFLEGVVTPFHIGTDRVQIGEEEKRTSLH